jgi:hypothetical protein
MPNERRTCSPRADVSNAAVRLVFAPAAGGRLAIVGASDRPRLLFAAAAPRPHHSGDDTVSRSPRKLLRQAQRALDDFAEVTGHHPDAQAEVERALGAEGVAELERARLVVGRAAAALDADVPPG